MLEHMWFPRKPPPMDALPGLTLSCMQLSDGRSDKGEEAAENISVHQSVSLSTFELPCSYSLDGAIKEVSCCPGIAI